MARKASPQLPEHVTHATAPPEGGDLLERLSFEHREIDRLWAQLQLAHRRRLDNQHQLAGQIVTALSEHEATELELLYPVVGDVVGEELAEHARQDHADIRVALDDVDGCDPADDEVFAALGRVMTMVLAHFEEEERIAFPMLRAIMPAEELAALGAGSLRPTGIAAEPEVIDLAAAEREAAEAAEAAPKDHKPGPASRARRLLMRR